jgi:hypothetical protein
MGYQEKITCEKCKSEYYRDLETIEMVGKHCETDSPLNAVIIKKFKCKKCKAVDNFNIEIVGNELEQNAI